VLSRYQVTANEKLFLALKRVLRYIKRTLHLKMKIDTSSNVEICGYVDSDWGGDTVDRKSTSGFIFKVFGCPVLWASKKQHCVSLSTTESEYIALTAAVTEACWLRQLLNDLYVFVSDKPVVIFEDNQSTINIANNPQNNRRIKHLDIKHFFIKRKLNVNQNRVY